jgi:hypothetical protein
MARTVKARREAYDDVAVGSAISTRERTVAGAAAPTLSWANGENIAVGSASGAEKIIVSGTSLMAGERLG